MEIDIASFREAGAAESTEALTKAIEADGATAVTGAPFAGRNLLLDHIETEYADTTRIELDPEDDLEDIPWPEPGTLIVEDAHHLYRREIGGFETLERFLRRVASTETEVIASWNRFAWAYLDQARELGRTFPTMIEAPALDAGQLGTLIKMLEDRTIVFQDDRDRNDQVIELVQHERSLGGRTITVPVPRINDEALRSLRKSDDPIEDAIFDRLASRSGGNIGVATALWERSVEDSTVSFANLISPPDADIGAEEAAVLLRLIANERMHRNRVTSIVTRPERILDRLEREKLIRTAGDMIAIEPVAVPSIIAALERRRLLW